MRSSVKMNCASCKYAILNMFVEPCCNCNEGSEFKPKTNADRIRSMTDDELAEWIAYRQGCFERQDKRCSKYGTCRDCWFDWLKEECE